MFTDLRVGIGVDVHRFADDRPLWLAGLEWSGERGLAGHSDADVACHAACDALLSAAGMGDLGAQFGTTDPEYAQASGHRLLSETSARLRAAGHVPQNVAVQIVGNRPKLATRRDEAVVVMTGAAGCHVSISATTTDGLGLTGRDEGIAAIATALVAIRPAAPL